MKKLVLILITFLVLGRFPTHAINFNRVNVAWQYDENFAVQMQHRVVGGQSGTTVFISITSDSLREWQYEFLIQDGYEAETHQSITPESLDTISQVGKQTIIKLLLPKIDESLLVLKFSKPERFYYYDISLKIGSFSFPDVYPVSEDGLPILKKFINKSGSRWKGNTSFLAMQYSEAFSPADPPMADMKPLAPQVDLDSTFVFSGSSAFEENYFYTVRKDSSAAIGVTMLRVAPYFPDSRTLVELAESMLYLTSEQEKKSILNAKNLKLAFDSFWMNTYATKARARNAIRKYYSWVRKANSLFTDFKPGWKTDRGMMFIVFGSPDEVYRTGNSEEWYYDDAKAFEFTIISSFFAPKTYTLRRSKDLEELWYNQITTLRRDI